MVMATKRAIAREGVMASNNDKTMATETTTMTNRTTAINTTMTTRTLTMTTKTTINMETTTGSGSWRSLAVAEEGNKGGFSGG